MKIVINKDHGGFGLSNEAFERYLTEKETVFRKVPNHYGFYFYTEEYDSLGDKAEMLWDMDITRNDPVLVRVVEEMGEDAFGRYAQLKVIEIPENVDWEIGEYDGMEWVAEKHRRWS